MGCSKLAFRSLIEEVVEEENKTKSGKERLYGGIFFIVFFLFIVSLLGLGIFLSHCSSRRNVVTKLVMVVFVLKFILL